MRSTIGNRIDASIMKVFVFSLYSLFLQYTKLLKLFYFYSVALFIPQE